MTRRTIDRAVTLCGFGIHSGIDVAVVCHPAPSGTGITFRRTDLPDRPEVAVNIDNVVASGRQTVLGLGEARIETVEHLLAAAMAAEIDDLLVELSGAELPILDGSFGPYVTLLEKGGLRLQTGEPSRYRIENPFELQSGESNYQVRPAGGLHLEVTVDWEHPSLGRQSAVYALDSDRFAQDIAPARTFGFAHEMESLHQRGLGRGARPGTGVLVTSAGTSDPPLHWPDEFARHKLGDLMGDLALLGGRLDAEIIADRPGHSGNVALVRALARAASPGGSS